MPFFFRIGVSRQVLHKVIFIAHYLKFLSYLLGADISLRNALLRFFHPRDDAPGIAIPQALRQAIEIHRFVGIFVVERAAEAGFQQEDSRVHTVHFQCKAEPENIFPVLLVRTGGGRLSVFIHPRQPIGESRAADRGNTVFLKLCLKKSDFLLRVVHRTVIAQLAEPPIDALPEQRPRLEFFEIFPFREPFFRDVFFKFPYLFPGHSGETSVFELRFLSHEAFPPVQHNFSILSGLFLIISPVSCPFNACTQNPTDFLGAESILPRKRKGATEL